MILYKVAAQATQATPFNCQPFQDTLNPADGNPLVISQKKDDLITLPQGVAFTLDAEPDGSPRDALHQREPLAVGHARHDLDAHDDPRLRRIKYDASFLFIGDPDISIPPQSTYTLGPVYFQVPAEYANSNFFAMTGHEHQYGHQGADLVRDERDRRRDRSSTRIRPGAIRSRRSSRRPSTSTPTAASSSSATGTTHRRARSRSARARARTRCASSGRTTTRPIRRARRFASTRARPGARVPTRAARAAPSARRSAAESPSSRLASYTTPVPPARLEDTTKRVEQWIDRLLREENIAHDGVDRACHRDDRLPLGFERGPHGCERGPHGCEPGAHGFE